MPTATVAEELVVRARKGDELSTEDRRHAVGWLIVKEPELTQIEMGQMFGVSDTTIRNDIKIIKQERAKFIKGDYVELIVSDLIADYERLASELEKSRKAATLGSANYREHVMAAMKMRLMIIEALQSLGWLDKNLGEMQVTKTVYKTEVQKGGMITVRPVDMFDNFQEGETLDQKLEREARERPRLTSASETDDGQAAPTEHDQPSPIQGSTT